MRPPTTPARASTSSVTSSRRSGEAADYIGQGVDQLSNLIQDIR